MSLSRFQMLLGKMLFQTFRHFIPEESTPSEPVTGEEADSEAFSHQQHLSDQANSDWQG